MTNYERIMGSPSELASLLYEIALTGGGTILGQVCHKCHLYESCDNDDNCPYTELQMYYKWLESEEEIL